MDLSPGGPASVYPAGDFLLQQCYLHVYLICMHAYHPPPFVRTQRVFSFFRDIISLPFQPSLKIPHPRRVPLMERYAYKVSVKPAYDRPVASQRQPKGLRTVIMTLESVELRVVTAGV